LVSQYHVTNITVSPVARPGTVMIGLTVHLGGGGGGGGGGALEE